MLVLQLHLKAPPKKSSNALKLHQQQQVRNMTAQYQHTYYIHITRIVTTTTTTHITRISNNNNNNSNNPKFFYTTETFCNLSACVVSRRFQDASKIIEQHINNNNNKHIFNR
jgi:hypothetical protein